MLDQIKTGKAATYSGEKRIEVAYITGAWDKCRTLTIAKRAEESAWRLYEDRREYVGNGMECRHTVTTYGCDLSLKEAKGLAVEILTKYHEQIARTA